MITCKSCLFAKLPPLSFHTQSEFTQHSRTRRSAARHTLFLCVDVLSCFEWRLSEQPPQTSETRGAARSCCRARESMWALKRTSREAAQHQLLQPFWQVCGQSYCRCVLRNRLLLRPRAPNFRRPCHNLQTQPQTCSQARSSQVVTEVGMAREEAEARLGCSTERAQASWRPWSTP